MLWLFAFISPSGTLETDVDQWERACDTLLMCIVTVLNHGLRNGGGVGDILRKPSKDVSLGGMWDPFFPPLSPAAYTAVQLPSLPGTVTLPALSPTVLRCFPPLFPYRIPVIPPHLVPSARGPCTKAARLEWLEETHVYPFCPLQESLFPARVVYDLLFFFIVIIIVLNLIFGVIIDTFADLRSEKQKKEEILKTTCFICGERWDLAVQELPQSSSPASKAEGRKGVSAGFWFSFGSQQNLNLFTDGWLQREEA